MYRRRGGPKLERYVILFCLRKTMLIVLKLRLFQIKKSCNLMRQLQLAFANNEGTCTRSLRHRCPG